MITIYTKDNCVFCDKAKALLESKSIPYRSYKIGEDVSREWVLESFPGMRTVPIILDGEKLLGGYDQLLAEVSKEDSSIGKTFLQD